MSKSSEHFFMRAGSACAAAILHSNRTLLEFATETIEGFDQNALFCLTRGCLDTKVNDLRVIGPITFIRGSDKVVNMNISLNIFTNIENRNDYFPDP